MKVCVLLLPVVAIENNVTKRETPSPALGISEFHQSYF